MIIEGSDLHPGQSRVVDAILGPAKYVTCVAPRQTGKSFVAQQIILYWALTFPGAKIFWIAPTYAQARKPFDELYEGIAAAGVIKSANRSNFELKFKNGSVVYFKSVERPDNIRGFTADFMICDESAYYGEDAWTSVLKPIMLVKGKKVLFISTPRGKNWFYNMYQYGLSAEYPDYATIRMHYHENPFVDQAEIEEAKRTLPEHIYQAEYEGSFVDSGQTVFTNLDQCTFHKWPKQSGRVYMGVDLGRQGDFTVATVMDDAGRVLEIYRDNQKEWHTMIDNIVKLAKKWQAQVLVEANSIGDVVYEQIKRQWPKTEPFNTTSSSKQQIIESLIVAFNKQEIQIPSRELFGALRFELEVFEYKYSPTARTVQYTAPNGLHDDTVMSLAIAWRAKEQMKTSGQYVMGNVKMQQKTIR